MGAPQDTSEAASSSSSGTEQVSFAPRPSYAVLGWAAIIAYSVFSGPRVFPIQIICFLVSLAACIWWFIFSWTHERRDVGRRLVGYITFGFGSMLPLSAGLVILMGEARGESQFQNVGCFVFILGIAGLLIAGGFYLVFSRVKSSPGGRGSATGDQM